MLENKVIVITGGAGLIGKEFARAVIENRGIAVIADISLENAERARDELLADSDLKSVDIIELDITSKKSLEDAIAYLEQKYQKIDALVNNAYPRNKNYGKHFFEVQYNDFCENLGMHLGGYFLTSQQFADFFKKQGYGNIINISSIYGVIAPKFEIYNGTAMTMPVEYAAIKSALLHLTKYMAQYFKGMNIRVNAISPGGIFDNQPERFVKNYKDKCLNKGMLDKDELTGSLIYLLSDMSKYVNGQNIIVDDGFSL
jgi:NAD(P)-dependent dehydrogenase (short-subunit alcohol dehydrogenase family)